ncbi:hypothetical protein McpCs1_01510 [Methanocorpusculaceae archaeon Cs1]|uniref:Uncharacterized protein n=1 Tax=Methanorbis rubei TaxID=3028300 RepID=A0AAE4SCT1_9EURY|nr:hypothetical protein [Methanocorpusculaceae archaeon Cs1]
MFGTYSVGYGVFLLIAVPVLLLCIGTAVDPSTVLLIVAVELILMAFPILAVEYQLKKQFSK